MMNGMTPLPWGEQACLGVSHLEHIEMLKPVLGVHVFEDRNGGR